MTNLLPTPPCVHLLVSEETLPWSSISLPSTSGLISMDERRVRTRPPASCWAGRPANQGPVPQLQKTGNPSRLQSPPLLGFPVAWETSSVACAIHSVTLTNPLLTAS